MTLVQLYLNQTSVFFHELTQNKTNDNTCFCTSLEHQIVLPDSEQSHVLSMNNELETYYQLS